MPSHPLSLPFVGRAHKVLVALLATLLCIACAEVPQGTQKPVEIPAFPPPPEQPRFIYERSLHSSADVLPDDKDASLRRLLTGEVRTGEGMSKPYGVAARNGRIYVGDTVDRSVVMFDLAQRRFKRFGIEEPGAMRMPFGIEADAKGDVYVVDGSLKRVLVYDADGKYLRSLGADQDLKRPVGIAIDDSRRRVYVVDAGGVDTPDHLIRVLDQDSGKRLFDIGKRGEAQGEFNLPRDAVVGPAGELYVVDGGNFRVQVFDVEGKFVKTFGAIGRQSGQFSRPKEIAIDAQGNLYVVDTAFGNFQVFDGDGRLLLDVGMRSNTDGPARFMLPSGIAVDRADGRVYMVDQFFRKVDVFRPATLPSGAAYGAR